MTNKEINDKLKGKTIIGVDLRPFTDDRGREFYRPAFTLDDGSRLVFAVEDTESVNERPNSTMNYGIRPLVFRRKAVVKR